MQMAENTTPSLLRKHVILPSDHGSWVFLLSPLLAGAIIGAAFSTHVLILVIGVMAAFLLRQPFTVAVKAYAGRRSKRDLPAARFWIVVYGLAALLSLAYLIMEGFIFLLWLAIPGLAVFAWYLWLVGRRKERKQLGLDVVASGVMALAAPAALWVSQGDALAAGWWLWALFWLQSAASIVYAFLRLDQRSLDEISSIAERLQTARRALSYTGFNLLITITLSAAGTIPAWIWLPYGLQFAETLWGTFNPAIGAKPTRIGMRQLLISSLFTVLFIAAWII